MSILIFFLIIFSLVLAHELGHFIFAKLSGMKVEEFGIGFPPKLFSFKKGGTIYSFNLFPIGGFVKILGENGDANEEGSFTKAPRYWQAIVLGAGVTFNIIFAWVLISFSLYLGMPVSASSLPKDIKPLSEKILITEVVENSPAQKAGLSTYDSVISIEVNNKLYKNLKSEEISKIVGNSKKDIKLVISRNGEERQLNIKPEKVSFDGRDFIGIGVAMEDIAIIKTSLPRSFLEGFKFTYQTLLKTQEEIIKFFYKIATGEGSVIKQAKGPVGLVGLIGETTQMGLAYLLSLSAIISINLAIVNLIPFPALDGGRLVMVGIEAIIRRPLNQKIVGALNSIGLLLLLLLMVAVTYSDIRNLFI